AQDNRHLHHRMPMYIPPKTVGSWKTAFDGPWHLLQKYYRTRNTITSAMDSATSFGTPAFTSRLTNLDLLHVSSASNASAICERYFRTLSAAFLLKGFRAFSSNQPPVRIIAAIVLSLISELTSF